MIRKLYQRLDSHYGNLHWWPGETPLEIIVGAVLTQNTSWTNVEKCMEQLKKARMLTLSSLRRAPLSVLATAIRSSGYYNQKSIKLKRFIEFLDSRYHGSLARMGKADTALLRCALLTVSGIGPETADSILLYAFHKPVFVVDAYTRRITARLGLLAGDEPYEDIRYFFESRIADMLGGFSANRGGRCRGGALTGIFNQYHALLVNLGKDFCRPRNPRCQKCPLNGLKQCRI